MEPLLPQRSDAAERRSTKRRQRNQLDRSAAALAILFRAARLSTHGTSYEPTLFSGAFMLPDTRHGQTSTRPIPPSQGRVTARTSMTTMRPKLIRRSCACLVTTPAGRSCSPIPDPSQVGAWRPTEDDISFLWLADSSKTTGAVATEANAVAAEIGQIDSGPTLSLL
jgi:hypothetical protein